MMVKICGITNREDALAAVEGGAAALGFNFYLKSPRYIAPKDAARLAEGLPASVWKVGVFVDEPAGRIEEIAALAGLDVAQIHGDQPPEDLPRSLRIWKAFRVDSSFGPALLDLYPAEAFLFDTPSVELHGGTGRTFDWTLAASTGRRVILAGGLDASNVREAIRTARPWGVDACSRLESVPGRKDHKKMIEFIQAALSETTA
jgi:phosphoribosylanthranilate isomerase